jgi:hypothetical protein
MNAWKALALGVVAGLAVSAGYGCSGSKCAASNCQGCCDNNGKCVVTASQTNAQCGASGNTCQACGSGQACNPGSSGGSCGACSGSNCGDAGSCNSSTCPTGCCAAGQCITSLALSNAECGQGGQSCQACLSGTSCQFTSTGGTCTSSPDSGTTEVGAPCKTNADCSGLGAGGTCLLQTSSGAVYVNGYCTLDCTVANCPGQSQCVGVGNPPQFGENTFQAFCWPPCTASQPCREPGYGCYGLTQADGGPAPTGGCWLDPAAPAGVVGHSCSLDTDCYTNAGPSQLPGACITQVTDAGCDGGAPFCQTGWTGGYCIADCSNWRTVNQTTGNEYCGDGGVCLTFTGGAALCFETCVNPGVQDVCRAGYICNSIPSSFGFTGRCFPDCRNPGFACGTGTSCDAGLCQ